MKNIVSAFVSAIAFIFITTSCNKTKNELARYIPKDASTVFIIDAKSVTDKINASGISLDSLANLFDKDGKGMHWNDIKNSGINLDKSFIVFAKQSTSMQAGKTESFGVVAEIKDKNALEQFLKKQSNNSEVKQGNKYQYISLSKGSIAGWNNDIMIICGASANGNFAANDSLSAKQLAALFAQDKSNAVVSIDEFNTMMKKTGDIHFWVNPSGSFNAVPMLGMTKINELFEGTYTEGVIDFENGKAVAKAETHINKTLGDILKKYPSKEIKKEMVTGFPGALNAFGIVSFDPKVLIDIVHFLGFDMMADGFTANVGFSTADIINAFSGDIAFMFARANETDNFITHNTDFIFSLRIGDKAAFNKVLKGLLDKNILSKNGDEYQLGMAGGHGFIIEITNDAVVIGTSDALIKSYASGNSKNAIPGDVEKEISGKSTAVYVDINSLMKRTSSTDTSGRKIFDMALSTFKNFIATTNKSDARSITSEYQLNFINSNENSLSSFVKFMAVAHDEQMKHLGWTIHPPMPHMPDDGDRNNNEGDSTND